MAVPGCAISIYTAIVYRPKHRPIQPQQLLHDSPLAVVSNGLRAASRVIRCPLLEHVGCCDEFHETAVIEESEVAMGNIQGLSHKLAHLSRVFQSVSLDLQSVRIY